MKSIIVAVLLVFPAMLHAGENSIPKIVVKNARGDVQVRRGVTESWMKVVNGDVLRPDDTFRTGVQGSALLVTSTGAGVKKTLTIPGEVIVDVSDVRDLSQEELMLKLTMEKVRSSSYEWKNNEMNIPNTTVVHGTNQGGGTSSAVSNEVGKFQMNGTRVLFSHGFYSTCALRAMDVLRRYPELAMDYENRVLLADALDKANLHGEALNEYVALLQSLHLTTPQSSYVQERVDALRKLSEH